jgi:hypothetical protein
MLAQVVLHSPVEDFALGTASDRGNTVVHVLLGLET